MARAMLSPSRLIMSSALPGMWIPADALKHRNWWTIMATIARGVTRLGHHDFMEEIMKFDRKRGY